MAEAPEEKESGLEMEVPNDCIDGYTLTEMDGKSYFALSAVDGMIKVEIVGQDDTQSEVLKNMIAKLEDGRSFKFKACV